VRCRARRSATAKPPRSSDLIVVGHQEMDDGTITVESYFDGKLHDLHRLDALLAHVRDEIDSKVHRRRSPVARSSEPPIGMQSQWHRFHVPVAARTAQGPGLRGCTEGVFTNRTRAGMARCEGSGGPSGVWS
jgi:hypothetical protein